jgi:hypothetical protein
LANIVRWLVDDDRWRRDGLVDERVALYTCGNLWGRWGWWSLWLRIWRWNLSN